MGDLTLKLTPFVGAGLNHEMENIMRSPANFRKVKRFHRLPDEELGSLPEPEGPKWSEDSDSDAYSEKDLARSDAEHGTDLALLELEKPWTFGEQTNIYPACLMDFQMEQFDDEFLVAGYGRIKPQLFTVSINETWNLTTSIRQQWSTHQWSEPLNLIAPNRSEWFRKFLMTKLRLLNSTEHLIVASSPHSSICFGMNSL